MELKNARSRDSLKLKLLRKRNKHVRLAKNVHMENNEKTQVFLFFGNRPIESNNTIARVVLLKIYSLLHTGYFESTILTEI